MRVFRIEDVYGNGIYAVEMGYEMSLAAGLDEYFPFEGHSNQPVPSEDGLTRGDEAWGKYYGFAGIPQLLNWINGCPVERLYEKGGLVIQLDVKKAEFGYNQCRFAETDIISRKPLKLYDLQRIL
ncbi:hypothetical protein MZD04_gp325 [Pseudomonas phage Psa21]|uniref:Uncharacterized protein n=1 Tax=Pseudomonas phage Psa21 TaxID=2530023 RepID=A0A481W4V9_9CAUD|nr:hypothetical protein MZD04_gp325 [Pseudomonas phage Psa21]QBJ02851.1 hypothetical protein PSA21_325 [Pseudomonas phage Psa21]